MRHGPVLVVSLIVVAAAAGVWYLRRPAHAPAQADPPPSDLVRLGLDSVAGWTASGPSATYDPESIYSYIDGHAEVYRAYGMRRCVSRRFAGPAGEPDLVVDVFELASPEDAFGVFTHDRDGEPAGVGNDSLFRHGWLSFWTGPYFVSIVAEGESERSRLAVLETGRAVARVLPQPGGGRPAIVDDLPAADLDPRSVRFLRHAQILNTHVFVSDDNVLALEPDTAAALGTYRRGSQRAFLLIVDYPDAARASAAAQGFRSALLEGAGEGEAVAVGERGYFALRVAGRRVRAVLAAQSVDLARELVARSAAAAGGAR